MIGITPNLTKAWIRERISDEEIFSFYLNQPVTFRTKFCSPLRKDNNPTCNYFISRNGILWMKDHSGHFAGNCYDLVMFMFGVNFTEALKIIAVDFNLIDADIKKDFKSVKQKKFIQEKSDIKFKIKKWTQSDLEYWKQYDIKLELLTYFNIVPVQHVWINDSLYYTHHKNDPAYAYVFSKTDLKIYFPKRKTGRFICNTTVLQGYNKLPQVGKLLIITKSYKDVVALFNFGIPAIAPQSETVGINKEQYSDLKTRFDKIYSLYDFDLTGIRTANKMKREYGIKPIFITNGRFRSYNYGAKDFTDCIKAMGGSRVYQKIISWL